MSTKFSLVKDLLQKTSVADIISLKAKRGQDLITLSSTTTLEQACKVLGEAGIQSAPVRDDNTGEYLGFLDQLDLVNYILKMYSEGKPGEVQWSNYLTDMSKLEARGEKFGTSPISRVLKSWSSAANKFVAVGASVSLWSIVDQCFSHGLHRVAVQNENGIIVDIVTQSDVVSLLANNIGNLGDFGDFTVAELNIGSTVLVKMKATAQMIHAFYLMHYNQIRSVLVVDDDGRLIGAISASDIKQIKSTNLPLLLKSVIQYATSHPYQMKPPITSDKNTPLANILVQMAVFRLHRITVVDEGLKPKAIISTTDIMQHIIKSCK